MRTKVHVEEGATSISRGNSIVVLTFNDEVRVKKTSVDPFSFLDSLNFFGSNLGLWPGLGLFQILEWMADLTLSVIFYFYQVFLNQK